MNIEKLKATFTQEVVDKVCSNLRAYSTCRICRENGVITVGGGTLIKQNYASDYKVWTVQNSEIFTKQERMLNYFNSFGEYSTEYKGKKNYLALKSWNAWSHKLKGLWKGIFVEGNIVIVLK